MGWHPQGTSNEESLVLFLKEFPSLMILLEANSLMIYVDKYFVLISGLHDH